MASINHDLNIIYFHIPKTGGTYIQTLLEEYYDFFSYNFLVRSDFHIFNEFNKKKTENYKDYLKVTPFSNRLFGVNNYYSGSKELIEATTLGEQKWSDSLKFTFVRDPYSRFISAFNFILSIPTISENLVDNDNYEKFENIDYFIDNKGELSDIAYNHVFLSQYDQIIDKDGINNMNFIGKQENLEEDLSNILLKVGFNEIKHIERRNVNKNRIDYNYYKTYYTEYSFNFVNKHFEKDFSEFNYKKYDNFNDFMSITL